MYKMTQEEFEQAVEDALDAIPDKFFRNLENVTVVIEDEPEPHHFASLENSGVVIERGPRKEILGLYSGVALTRRGTSYGEAQPPDVITIFKGPHERCFFTREQVVEQIGKTVVHEIGHYFGLDDKRLRELGY